MTASPSPVVLVHGAWHGAWCFAALQQALDDRGVPSYAVDLPGHGASTLPLGDLHGDATHVADVLAALGPHRGGPAVLVGHSYGGAVITEAAVRHPDVAHLVYLCAFALQEGESVLGFLGSQPREDVALGGAMVRAEGGSVLDPALAPGALYGDCTPAQIAAAVARLSPQPDATMIQPVTGSPLDRLPSTYVRCLRDQAVHPTHQAAMAARCTDAVDFDCDHSPFMSMTAATADLLAAIAHGAGA